VTVIQKDGRKYNLTLLDVKFVPGIWVNLFAIGKALARGFQISNKGTTVTLMKDNIKITFDNIIHTSRGYVMGVEMLPRETSSVAAVATDRGTELRWNDIHYKLSHVGEETIRHTAKYYGWTLKGSLNTCEDCALSKARQRNIPKETATKSTQKGERLFIDISSVSGQSFGGRTFWLLVVDDFTDYCWSFFLHEKSDLSVHMITLVLDLEKKNNIKVKNIRCDGAGENKSFKDDALTKGLGLNFEFTPRNTLQFNGKAERKFQTLFGRV